MYSPHARCNEEYVESGRDKYGIYIIRLGQLDLWERESFKSGVRWSWDPTWLIAYLLPAGLPTVSWRYCWVGSKIALKIMKLIYYLLPFTSYPCCHCKLSMTQIYKISKFKRKNTG
ncbi:hypothetical protein RhiirA1_395216 [Rhizophagus irregularis]|uniref:Uncharacterized protein n=1 Tax=Rhizophagus irregularis TaxID=588596 RepID=A0A2N0RQH7_9GLOM|nr:hypothetical protein RhiirA1_395216 [Rhizophagus irregularis]